MGGESDSHEFAASRAGIKRGAKPDEAAQEKQPPAKRSRVSRACDQCRASREKCDGGQPVCQTCISQKRRCSYEEQPKKRGIQPNYIRTLELTLSWIFENLPDCERKLSTVLASPDVSARRLIAGKDGRSEAFHQRWRNNIVCRQIDQMLSGAAIEQPMISLDLTSQSPTLPVPSEQPIGMPGGTESSGLVNPSNLNTETPPQPAQRDFRSVVGDYSSQQEPQPANWQSFGPVQTLQSSNRRGDAVPPDRLPLPDHAWTLLEYYFAFIHAWLPLTDRQATLKLMYAYPADGNLSHKVSNGDIHELWSILALSAFLMPQYQAQSENEDIHATARSLMPSEGGPVELGHLKAHILLAILQITKQRWLAAWQLIGYAVRVILILTSSRFDAFMASQIHFATPVSDLAAEGKLKRLALAAYVVESAIAAQLGAPTHLRPGLINLMGSVVEDGLEEWSPWHDPLNKASMGEAKTPARSHSTLNQLVRLALRNEDAAPTDTEAATGPPSLVLTTLLRLLHNAVQAEKRQQPAVIVSECESIIQESTNSLTTNLQSANGVFNTDPLSGTPPSQQYAQQQRGYMSIPEPAESAFSGSPNWMPEPLSNTEGQVDDKPMLSGDIFEELAMLERNDSRSNPQFMQNLGFAPDIDLAEFFGADYQPSDPMLAYMQPSLFSPPPGSSRTAPDAG